MSASDDALRSVLDDLAGRSDCTVAVDAPFGALTTYRVGGLAAAVITVNSRDALMALSAVAVERSVPLVVIGRGSNMLVADRGFPGIVVRLGAFADAITVADDDGDAGRVVLAAGAAAALPVVARQSAASGLCGFEWAVGVPGSIGGAVRMNAGGHGSDMAAVVTSADVFDARTVSTSDRPVSELGLGFRSSALTDDEVVLAARLSLHRCDSRHATGRLEEIVRWRREHQPGGQNCGSVFVNPVPGKVSAGALIDQLGLRGFRIGSAEVSLRHANFIQADPGGSADDVASVIEVVRRRVRDSLGYELRSEVRMIGFDSPLGFSISR